MAIFLVIQTHFSHRDDAWQRGRKSALSGDNDSLVLAGIGADVKERRRIEIRLRKSDRVGLPIAAPPITNIKKKQASSPPPATAEVDTAGVQAQPTLQGPVKPAAKPQLESEGVKTPFGWFFRN